ncbi:MAG TPA: PilC/PilY family type IV pilus protein [Burkholderiales bacterium]|nr:PilC/PilY family type IV pilus protein [Burkholderiales bacterium]
MNKPIIKTVKHTLTWLMAVLTAFLPMGNYAQAALTVLADEPTVAGAFIPPNVMLDLSVEFPTGLVAAYSDHERVQLTAVDGSPRKCPGHISNEGFCYFRDVTYYGYFDPNKCYDYNPNIISRTEDGTRGAFVPASKTINTFHECSQKWSGNYLNWAATQAIDGFRWVMTGGNRSVDTTTTTILEKARATGQGYYGFFPIKRVGGAPVNHNGVTIAPVEPRTVTPYNTPVLYLHVHNGWHLADPPGTPAGSGGFVMEISTMKTFPPAPASPDFTQSFFVRVKVCDPFAPGGLEPNCTKYGSIYKPTGVMQERSAAMRFGAFGYALENTRERAGGVLRARMKDIGPQKFIPGVGLVNNPTTPSGGREWSPNTGIFFDNPDSNDAVASGVGNSGVINYLNKFGRENAYKGFDPVSELYYESLRYLRGLKAPIPEYIKDITPAMLDGFPVIKNWDDPLQYSCQKNYIITIGDENTNCDTLLPGNSLTGTCNNHAGPISPADPAINVTTLTNKVGQLEGLGDLGSIYHPFNRGNTYYIAGLAYWANTNDFRPDNSADPKSKGKQTIKSFFIDVLEEPLGGPRPGGVNQYYLAAKYGGFVDENNNGVPANSKTFDKDGNGIPDNLFGANQPDQLAKSLRQIFEKIAAETSAGTGAGVANPNFDTDSAGNSVYQTYFTPGDWSGDVEGGILDINEVEITDGAGVKRNTFTSKYTKSWNAQEKLDLATAGNGWKNRKIATISNGVPVQFRRASLSTAQRAALGSTTPEQNNMIDYISGDQAKEGSTFRDRAHILGDIVHSKVVPVADKTALYQEYANPGYAAFKAKTRKKMVYVGANDGMLHAFNGETDLTKDPKGGEEVWAYIPSLVITGPSGTPSVDGLAAYASPTTPYLHHYYVDQTPEVRDVDFSKTADLLTQKLAPDWRTILVGGLGKGGKGFYALDVTDGANAGNINAVTKKVLWEFTDSDMGFSYGRPVIVKTAPHGWVVLFTSGHNNVSGGNAGKGFLYVVNAKTGQLIDKIGTGSGSAATPSGLGRGTAFIPNFDDFTADQFYVGDLLGDLWRFDLRKLNSSGKYPKPSHFAELKGPTGQRQAISVAPQVEIARNGRDRWVFIGTGKDLSSTDASEPQQQTMYAFRDGTKADPLDIPGSPQSRSDLNAVTDLTKGIPAPEQGWLFDLPGGSQATGRERIILDLDANSGVISFVGNISSNDPCSVGGTSNVYATEYDTGLTVLQNEQRKPIPSITGAAVVGAKLISVNRKLSILITDSKGKQSVPTAELRTPAFGSAVMNWREILE